MITSITNYFRLNPTGFFKQVWNDRLTPLFQSAIQGGKGIVAAISRRHVAIAATAGSLAALILFCYRKYRSPAPSQIAPHTLIMDRVIHPPQNSARTRYVPRVLHESQAAEQQPLPQARASQIPERTENREQMERLRERFRQLSEDCEDLLTREREQPAAEEPVRAVRKHQRRTIDNAGLRQIRNHLDANQLETIRQQRERPQPNEPRERPQANEPRERPQANEPRASLFDRAQQMVEREQYLQRERTVRKHHRRAPLYKHVRDFFKSRENEARDIREANETARIAGEFLKARDEEAHAEALYEKAGEFIKAREEELKASPAETHPARKHHRRGSSKKVRTQ